MDKFQDVGMWMSIISTFLIIFALVLAFTDNRPKKEPHER